MVTLTFVRMANTPLTTKWGKPKVSGKISTLTPSNGMPNSFTLLLMEKATIVSG